MNTLLKKLLVSVLLVPLVVGPLVLSGPRVVHAQVFTHEVNPVVVLGVGNTAAATSIQSTIMEVLNGVAWAAAKAVIQGMTRSIVQWINSGFEGKPAFEQNISLSLRNAADVQVGRVFSALSNSELVQSPFLEQVIMGVGAAYYISSSEERIQQRLRYTLNQVTANDRAFLQGDFSQGGFNAWMSAVMNPQNNPVGAQFILGQEVARQLESTAFRQIEELRWGRGFLSWRGDCLLRAENNSQTGTPTANLGAEDNCLQYDIQTPGSFIEGQLGVTASSPLRQLELADSINEIVGALAVQMVTQVLGSTGLLGASQPSPGGGRSLLDQATDTNNTQNTGIKQTIEKSKADTVAYQTGWQKILGAATTAKNACAGDPEELSEATSIESVAKTSVEKSTSALTQIDSLLSQLQGNPSKATVSAVSDQYVALMSSGDVPTSSEAQNATAQSASTGDTLYTQMVALAAQCQ